MSVSKVTGEVAAISDYDSNDYFNICLDDTESNDNWYIGDGSTDQFVENLKKGVKVRLHIDSNKESVTGIDVIQPESQDSQDDSNEEYISKDESITRKVAFKEACETARSLACYGAEQHLENVEHLSQEYYEILSNLGEEQ